MCTPPEFYSCQMSSDVVRFCQILFPSKPVVRAIELSHAACKDEVRENPRLTAVVFLIFLVYIMTDCTFIFNPNCDYVSGQSGA